MSSSRRWATWLFVLASLQLIGICLFSIGFFPYKVYLNGFATEQDGASSFLTSHLHKNHWQQPTFDRLVFIVVDALRNDFILGEQSGFGFVKSGKAIPFTARATAPTVTMPRIKALTTGTIPSFLDAILNIAESDTSSSLEFYDNWVYQLKNSGNKTLNFFGDDTWVRLFPGLFDKIDGTTSFYVSDTVQVDLNVTRHIEKEVLDDDWDVTILHYLGLDHIGHLSGPGSPLMIPKQKEMDEAVKLIYETVTKQDEERLRQKPESKGTLIVLCGDHGMNKNGNHGGSSIEETSAALVFLGSKFQSRPLPKRTNFDPELVMGYPVVDQIDLVPTLATLLAFPIPKNNLGKVIIDLMKADDYQSILQALHLNAFQLSRITEKTNLSIKKYIQDPLSFVDDDSDAHGKLFAYAASLHKQYLSTDKDSIAIESIEAYQNFINVIQPHLVNTASDYKLSYMMMGVFMMTLSGIAFFIWSVRLDHRKRVDWNSLRYFSFFLIIAYAISMFTSSFIEEEHTTWYFFLQTTFLLFGIYSASFSLNLQSKMYCVGLCFCQMVLFRIAMAWNGVAFFTLLQHGFSKWDLAALTLCVISSLAVLQALTFGKKQSIDVDGTAYIIQKITQITYCFLITLCSILVLVYKIRSELVGIDNCDGLSRSSFGRYCLLLDIDLVKQLDQVQLGKLIYNYSFSSFFVLFGLCYVTKKAELLNIEERMSLESNHSKFLKLFLYTITPLLILLSSTQNSGLFLLFCLQYHVFGLWKKSVSNHCPIPSWLLGIYTLCLCHTSFFATAHSNSIASIDLGQAYVGVDGYNTALIGILSFVSNWSGSIWWSVAGWSWVIDTKETRRRWISYLITQSAFFGLAISSLSMAVSILREHLFIWTVFSPKYLYQTAWNSMFHWIFQVLIGTFFVLGIEQKEGKNYHQGSEAISDSSISE